jgi:hypothetical protein
MTDETPKRTYRRRRWIVAGVFLVAICSIWVTLRSDSRFVGKWAVTTPTSSNIDWELSGFRVGVAHVTNSKGRLRMLTFSWVVRDGQLRFGWHNQEKTFRAYMKRYAETVFDQDTIVESYDIISVGDDEITLREAISQDTVTLRRIQ